MKNIVEKIQKYIKKWNDGKHYKVLYDGDFVLTYKEGSRYNPSIYSCKEEFVSDSCGDGNKICKTNYFFVAKNDDWIDHLHNIEDALNIKRSKITKYVISDMDEEKNIYKISNPLWFKDLIRLDMFCCVFKTIVSHTDNVKRSKKKNPVDKLSGLQYFEYPYMVRALKDIKTLVKKLKLDVPQDEFLFTYENNGLVSALDNHKYSQSD